MSDIAWSRWKLARYHWKTSYRSHRKARIKQALNILLTRPSLLWYHVPMISAAPVLSFIDAMNPKVHERIEREHEAWIKKEFAK